MSQVKFINKINLRIARENIGLDTSGASKRISNSKVDFVREWENGNSLPTWSQVIKLAKLYNTPELLFFSQDNLTKDKIVPDYRVVSTDKNSASNFKIKKLVNLVTTRQRWLEKTLREEGFSKNNLQGSGKNKTPKELANFIIKSLEIDRGLIKRISGTYARKKTLEYLIQKAENKGVFVGKTISYHKLTVGDMRGLFISNDFCPFIIINRQDALSAQIFSFIHELAHLFRRSDAISNSLEFRTIGKGIEPEEIFCNKVAIELLLPSEDFTKDFYNKLDIDAISGLYKVSNISIFYRLKELGKIQKEIQSDLEKQILQETTKNIAESKKRKKKGGDHTNSMKDSNGKLFNRIVSGLYSESKIGYVEASKLLRCSVEKI